MATGPVVSIPTLPPIWTRMELPRLLMLVQSGKGFVARCRSPGPPSVGEGKTTWKPGDYQCGATFLLNSADSEELPKREMDLDKELVSVIIERRDIPGPRLITGALSCVSSTARYGLSNLKFEPQC